MPQRRTTRPPFNRRSRQAQKRAYWQVLGKIRRAAPVLGGRFYTHHYLHGENGWIDGFFLGNKKPSFYNLYLQTASYAYKELVSSRAWELSYELAPLDLDLSILKRTAKDPVSGLYVTSPREPYRYPEFDGMTRYEWTQAQNQRIADSLEIQVFEHWTLHHDYHSGIGLHATIDVPFLTIEAVNAFIERFLASEANFTGKTPRSFRFDEIPYWDWSPTLFVIPGIGPMLRRRNRTVNLATDPSYPRMTMTVLELINLLKTMPPQAEVVIPVYQDRADEYCVRSLDASQVQVIQMRKAPEIKGILKPARTLACSFWRQRVDCPGLSLGMTATMDR